MQSKAVFNLVEMGNVLDDEDGTKMIALLRDRFLDTKAISDEMGWDVLPEMMADPKEVLYYTAYYIEMLKEK